MKKLFIKLWNSPTFTTWGSQMTQAMRLFAVTPLILRNFDTSEIAAWYLFGSIMFLGDMINSRMSLTFTRMIAFAMGGATDLAPIKENVKVKNQGGPNWSLLERAYGTIGGLNLVLALINAAVALVMGWYGLTSIAAASTAPNDIWLAFVIVLVSKTITNVYLHYGMTLKGMNEVALVNRWDVITALMSITGGFIALSMGANIWQLAATMQAFTLINIFRNRTLLFRIAGNRFRNFKGYLADREVWDWAAQPFFKGMAINFSNTGIVQFAGVIYARHATVEAVAAYLFTMRMMSILQQICMTPYNSHQPVMSRLMAQGKIAELAKMVQQRILTSQFIFVAGTAGLALVGARLLKFIGANSSLLPHEQIAIIGFLLLIKQYQISTLTISAIGNHIVCFWRTLISGCISLALALWAIPEFGIWGLLVSAYLPQIFALNIESTKIAARRLECSSVTHFWKSSGVPISVQIIAVAVSPFLMNL